MSAVNPTGPMPDWNSLTPATPQDLAAATVPVQGAPAAGSLPAVNFNVAGNGPTPPAPTVPVSQQTPDQLSGEVPLPDAATPSWDSMTPATPEDISAAPQKPIKAKSSIGQQINDAAAGIDNRFNTFLNKSAGDTNNDASTKDALSAPPVDYSKASTYGHAGLALAGSMASNVQDLNTTASKVIGATFYGLDKLGVQTNNYDWWNRNITQPSQATAESDRLFTANEVKRSGVLGDIGDVVGNVSTQMAEMVLLGGSQKAAAISSAMPKEGLAAVSSIIKDAIVHSAKASATPAAVEASRTYDEVYKKTGDPQAAVLASITAGSTLIANNVIPMSVEGPILWRAITGGLIGGVGSEFQRTVNNMARPDNMQVPFTWKGAMTAMAAGGTMGAAFGHAEPDDPQVAAMRYNAIFDSANKGNMGAARTVEVANNLSHVDGLSNPVVDAAVHGVVQASNKMAKTHEQLVTEDPRYQSIFQATQTGPIAVDPATGEQIARETYAKEVSLNTAWDHYLKATGAKDQSLRMVADAKNMMDLASKTVPSQELELLSRWAAYDQPSQLQFNNTLRNTIESKQAPDFVHDRYDGDFGPDGVPNDKAFQRDEHASPNSWDVYYAPDPKVEQALRAGDIHYYRMADGRLAVRGSSADYSTNVISHIFDQTGATALKPGETYENPTATAAHSEQEVRPEVTAPVAGSGIVANEGNQAQTGEPQQPNGKQDGHEGNGQTQRAGSQLGDEGNGHVVAGAENLTPRAAPVADALAKAGVSNATVTPQGEVKIAPGASPEEAQKAMDVAASDTAASNTEYPEPTPKESAAGNYRKGGVTFPSKDGDVRMRIENPDGSVRKGSWGSRPIKGAHYGYIPDTISADGAPLDVLATHNAHDDTRPVAVLSQHDPSTGKFDELKVVMGAKSKGEAMSVYGRQYPNGMLDKLLPDGRDNVVMMSRAKFAKFIKSGATDVPPHPVSGAPQLSMRENADFTGVAGEAKPEDLSSKVDAVNAKHGTNLKFTHENGTITGVVPKAKALAIHQSLSRVDGYSGSKLDGQDIQKTTDLAGTGEGEPSGKTAQGQSEHAAPVDGERGQGSDAPPSEHFVGTRHAANSGSGRILTTFDPKPEFSDKLQKGGAKPISINELDHSDESAQKFESALQSAKKENPWGAQVYAYPREEYKGFRTFLTDDGKAGFALKPDGDIVSVFSTKGGKSARSLLALAVQEGGNKLDNFDTQLTRIYQRAGFREVGREPWNEEYKPEGWGKQQYAEFNHGEPDVVRMEYDRAHDQNAQTHSGAMTEAIARYAADHVQPKLRSAEVIAKEKLDAHLKEKVGEKASHAIRKKGEPKDKADTYTNTPENAKVVSKERIERVSEHQEVKEKVGELAADQLKKKGDASPRLNLPDEHVAIVAATHHDAITAHVAEVTKVWKGATLHVLPDRASAPAAVQPWMDHYLAPGETPAGMYHNGHVYLFSPSLHDEAHADRTVLHEMVGHFGLQGTFGDRLNPLLDSIHASFKGRPDFRAISDKYSKAYVGLKGADFRRAVTEEYLAKAAEGVGKPGVVAKFTAWIRSWAASHGMKVQWNDQQVRNLLGKVAGDVRDGRVSVAGLEAPDTLFHDETGIATSTYHGVAGRGEIDHNPDGSRTLRVDGLQATLHPSVVNGKPFNSVSDLTIHTPDDLAKLARFAQEEGKTGVAIGKQNVTKAQIEASGVPFKNRPGFYELASTGKLPDNPMFSLRNRAKGDPETEAILDKTIAHSTLDMTPWDRMQHAMRDFRDNIQNGDTALKLKQAWVDSGAVLDKYERHVNGGLLLDAAQSAYKAFHLARNNEQITAGVLKLGVPEYKDGSFQSVDGRKGFLDILAPLYKTPDGKVLDKLFEGYAVAKRANELIDQTNPDGTSKEKLLTRPEIDKLMSLDQQYPVFKTVLKGVQDFNNQLLDLAVDRGTMSKDVADMWKKNMYVPFYRSMAENEGTQWANGKSIGGKKVTSARLYGSEEKIQPVIENIIRNTSSVLDKVYSNEAMRRIVGLTEGIGMERAKLPMQAIRMSSDEMIGLLHKAGIDVDKSNLTEDDLNTLTTIFRPSKPIGPDITSVVENGKNFYYRVTDPLLLRAVSGMSSYKGLSPVLDTLLGVSKKIYTVGTTLDPRFMFRIMLKDAMQSWIQTGTNPNMFKNVGANAKEIYTDGKFLNQLRVAGYNGNEYYKVHEVRDHLQEMHGNNWSILSTPAKIYRAYQHIGWMSEQLSRINIARQTLQGGGSMAEAAWQGQNTLNWQKHGDGQAAQLIMRGAPFLNAHIQGLARIYDGAMGRDVTQNRSRAVTSFLLKTLGIAAASLALANHNEKDPRYERLPDEAKDLYWHFFVGNHHYALAKPFEIGALSATIPERVMRVIQGQDTKKEFVASMGNVVNEMFGINPIPVAALPVAEDWANKDAYTGLPIVSQRNQGLQPGAQENTTTSPAIAALAHTMPSMAPDVLRSPVRLQHLIRGYTSTIGMYLTQMADAAVTATSKNAPPQPASRFGNPLMAGLANTFNVEDSSTDPRDRYIGAVYDAQKSADTAAKTFHADIKAGHLADAREVMQNNKTALQYRNEIHAVAKQMGQLRNMEQQIYQSPSMTPEEKRAKLDEINSVRVHLLDKVGPMLDMVNDYH